MILKSIFQLRSLYDRVVANLQTYNHIYTSREKLKELIDSHRLEDQIHVLVQIFTGVVDNQSIKQLISEITQLLPQATIVGVTTDGEISSGEVMLNKTVLSISVFDHTRIRSAIIEKDGHDSRTLGEMLAKQLISKDTKVLLLFADGLSIDAQEFLRGAESVSGSVKISGGMAGDNGRYLRTFIMNEEKVLERGAVGVALDNEDLIVHSFYNHNWFRVGKTFTITEATGRRVYTINQIPAVDLYHKYLGISASSDLMTVATWFPLVVTRDGETKSLFIDRVHRDGSITFNEAVLAQEKVQFSYGNTAAMYEKTLDIARQLNKLPVESIFVYSCMARRRFLQHFAENEVSIFQKLAPTAGYFSYGEFYRTDQGARAFNQTMTLLCVSENAQNVPQPRVLENFDIPDEHRSFVAVSNFLHATTEEMGNLYANLEESEQQYRSLFQHNTDVVYSTDLSGEFTSVNKSFEKLLGYDADEVLHTNSLDFIYKEDIPKVKRHFIRALQGKEQYYDLRVKAKDGRHLLFQIKNVPIIVNGNKVGVFGIGRDITEQKRAEEQIAFLAYHDSQTGLPNRDFFIEQSKIYMERARKNQSKLALLFLDLDHFKLINDSLGHFAGDEVIKQLIEKLKDALRTDSFLSRFGGDEFTLLVPDVDSLDELIETSQDLLQNLSKPILLDDKEFFITASIGISLFPDDGTDSETLLKNAHAAMYRAKQQGRNRIKFYAAEMNEQALQRLEMEGYLRKALEKDEFFLCYQPLIDAETGEVFGSEALIRWNHPKLGLVSPAEFIPLAEETGLIEEIGQWVLKSACIQNVKWQQSGFADLSISVNVSARQFQKNDFVQDVKAALSESGLAPEYLNLELTESTMLRNIKYSMEVMKELREMGVQVSIDDFGTGYSSLSYLKHLPISMIKIDRSFIKNLKIDDYDIAIVKAIITMGQGLSVRVLAEGVEKKEQMELLKEMKCHYLQGYFFNRPVPADLFESELREQLSSRGS